MHISVALCLVSAMANANSILYMGWRTETVNFDTASSRCAAFGGQLATFGSDGEFASLLDVRNALGVTAWIGLTDRDTESHWSFVDGDTSFCSPTAPGPALDCDDIPQWYPGEPNNSGNEDCAHLWSSSINDAPCGYSYAYICEFNGDNYALASEGGAIYVARRESVNYATAKTRCAGIGGQLATFDGEDQFQALLSVRNVLGQTAWIGLDDLNQEHHWQFVDGDLSYCEPQGPGLDCDDISQWAAGEPNNWGSGDGEDCAHLLSSSINDAACGYSYPYICEFDGDTFAYADDAEVYDIDFVGDGPDGPRSYFVFEVTGLEGTGTLMLICSLMLCVVCLSCLLCKNYQSAHAKGYKKVVMDTDSEL